MKIGIITHWKDLDNYGAALQSFALQRYLRDLGHDAFVIRYYQKAKTPTLAQKLLYVAMHPMVLFDRKKNKAKLSKIPEWNKLRDFDSFRNQNIALSEKVYNGFQDLKENYPAADIYITGSDQVWGGSLVNDQNRAFFLDFGTDETKRIAYAASFGRGYFPCEDEELFKKLLSRFTAISMREESGVRLLKERGMESIRCLDSTLLLSLDKYLPLVSENIHNFPFAFFYTVNVSNPQEIYWEQIHELLQKKGIESIVTTGSGYLQPEEMFDGAVYDYATVEGWLSNIAHSRLVVTASFHGVVFSFLFKKNFIYMPLKAKSAKGNNRVTDLLESVGLTGRMANDWNDVERLVEEEIDYEVLNDSNFQALLEQSMEFIYKAIK